MNSGDKIQSGVRDQSKGNQRNSVPGVLDKPKTSQGGTGAVGNPNKMTERERLQADLRKTLTEFKEQHQKKERNGQAAQGGQKAANNRLVGNYLVGKSLCPSFRKIRLLTKYV